MSDGRANIPIMVNWQEFSTDAPQFAAGVRERFEQAQHHVLATVRRDGHPRVSGTELQWRGTELEFGSMPMAMKAQDLRRDPRMAVHCNPGAGDSTPMDVKISGTAIEVVDPAAHQAWIDEVQPPSTESHLFQLDLAEVTSTEVGEDQQHLVIKLWRPGNGVIVFKRL